MAGIPFHQAGVTVGKEAVVLGDGVGIGGFDAIEAGKRGDQHEQGRARQVEIGQEQVDRAKPVARRSAK